MIGDDAAVIGSQVITVDMLVEDVDFISELPLRFAGRKSVAVNLSDLAAMGAEPRYAVVALAAPSEETASAVMAGVAEAAAFHGLRIVGGDLSRADKIVVALTAVGQTERPLLRSGARPGERLFVSRPLGAATAGLTLLGRGWRLDDKGQLRGPDGMSYAERELIASLLKRHVDPEPEVALGIALSRSTAVSCCIDISDGLSTDLHRLCEASGCGAEVEKERIPVFPDLIQHAARLEIPLAEAVLHGGEEYALLFTSALRESELSSRLGRPVYAIGRIVAEAGVRLSEGGASSPLPARGWDHFPC